MSGLVANPEDWFSRVADHFSSSVFSLLQYKDNPPQNHHGVVSKKLLEGMDFRGP